MAEILQQPARRAVGCTVRFIFSFRFSCYINKADLPILVHPINELQLVSWRLKAFDAKLGKVFIPMAFLRHKAPASLDYRSICIQFYLRARIRIVSENIEYLAFGVCLWVWEVKRDRSTTINPVNLKAAH